MNKSPFSHLFRFIIWVSISVFSSLFIFSAHPILTLFSIFLRMKFGSLLQTLFFLRTKKKHNSELSLKLQLTNWQTDRWNQYSIHSHNLKQKNKGSGHNSVNLMQTSFNSHVIAPQGPIYQERFILALLLFTRCRSAKTSRSNSVMLGSQITHGLSPVTGTLEPVWRAGRSCSHIYYNRQFTERYLYLCQLAVLSLSRSGHTGTHTRDKSNSGTFYSLLLAQ